MGKIFEIYLLITIQERKIIIVIVILIVILIYIKFCLERTLLSYHMKSLAPTNTERSVTASFARNFAVHNFSNNKF